MIYRGAISWPLRCSAGIVILFWSSLAFGQTTIIDAGDQHARIRPPITAVAIDEKNLVAIIGSQAGLIVHAWPDLDRVRPLPTKLDHIHDIAISPDGTLLAAAGGSPAESGAIELFRWPTGELWKSIADHRDLVQALAWRDDSEQFATASADKSVRVYERTTANCLHILEGHSRAVMAVEYLSGKMGLVTAGVDESLRFWELESGDGRVDSPRRTFTNHTRAVYDLAKLPAAGSGPPIVASIGEDHTVRLWQPTVGRMMRFVKLTSVPLAVCWTSDGRLLLASCKDGHIRTIDPDTVAVVAEQQAFAGPAYSLAVANNGDILAGGVIGSLRRLALPPSVASASPKSP